MTKRSCNKWFHKNKKYSKIPNKLKGALKFMQNFVRRKQKSRKRRYELKHGTMSKKRRLLVEALSGWWFDSDRTKDQWKKWCAVARFYHWTSHKQWTDAIILSARQIQQIQWLEDYWTQTCILHQIDDKFKVIHHYPVLKFLREINHPYNIKVFPLTKKQST